MKSSKNHTVLVITLASLFGIAFDSILAITGLLDTLPKVAVVVFFTLLFVLIVSSLTRLSKK